MFGFGREKPKAPSAEAMDERGRTNDQVWADGIAARRAASEGKFNEPLMRPDESVIEPVGISQESISRGYEGSVANGVGSIAEQVPQIDLEAEERDKVVKLDELRNRIKASGNHSDDSEKRVA